MLEPLLNALLPAQPSAAPRRMWLAAILLFPVALVGPADRRPILAVRMTAARVVRPLILVAAMALGENFSLLRFTPIDAY